MKKLSKAEIESSIVKIINPENNNLIGNGFCIKDGYIITCHHVIFNIDRIVIVAYDNKFYYPEWCENLSNPSVDIAILFSEKIKGIIKPLPIVLSPKHHKSVNIFGFSNKNHF